MIAQNSTTSQNHEVALWLLRKLSNISKRQLSIEGIARSLSEWNLLPWLHTLADFKVTSSTPRPKKTTSTAEWSRVPSTSPPPEPSNGAEPSPAPPFPRPTPQPIVGTKRRRTGVTSSSTVE
ncbi:hypothetical protein M422DRAFT_783723 [Sphaerobolus stellatus SS14]|uniref:Uncharacterized protein n=1 Tax=Sphaerobolus stellatus (strain SS14) TaxID=990650 RepID=A0A0C9TNU1_SPHS4|nr:hypothetical protein M422DRAFT_783723 [Sphaerobolus stellatus SS14]